MRFVNPNVENKILKQQSAVNERVDISIFQQNKA